MQPAEPNIDARYRSMIVIWTAIFLSIGMYLVFIWMRPAVPDPEKAKLALILVSASAIPVAISFLVKDKLLGKAAEEQKAEQVQSAYVVAFALCEAAVLLGVLTHFVTGSPFYLLAMAVGAIGILLHFPRKKHLLEATYKPF